MQVLPLHTVSMLIGLINVQILLTTLMCENVITTSEKYFIIYYILQVSLAHTFGKLLANDTITCMYYELRYELRNKLDIYSVVILQE